jgi:outer membrane protein
MHLHTYLSIFSVCLLLLAPSGAFSAETKDNSSSAPKCESENADCQKIGSWEFSLAFGFGGRTNPLVDGDDQPIVLVPSFSWYGKRFFIDTFEAGYTFIDREQHMLNAIVQPGFDQVYFDEFGFGNFALGDNFSAGGISNAIASTSGEFAGAPIVDSGSSQGDEPETNEMRQSEVIVTELRDRKMAALGGLEYSYFNGPWQLQIAALSDLSNVHNGSEIKASASFRRQHKTHLFQIAAGFAWQSDRLLDYYYGLDTTEVSRDEFAYEASDGISSFAKLSWTKIISKRWALVSALQFRKFDHELKNSPILEEDIVTTAFIGGRYHF